MRNSQVRRFVNLNLHISNICFKFAFEKFWFANRQFTFAHRFFCDFFRIFVRSKQRPFLGWFSGRLRCGELLINGSLIFPGRDAKFLTSITSFSGNGNFWCLSKIDNPSPSLILIFLYRGYSIKVEGVLATQRN